jgi:hypothetical protein
MIGRCFQFGTNIYIVPKFINLRFQIMDIITTDSVVPCILIADKTL